MTQILRSWRQYGPAEKAMSVHPYKIAFVAVNVGRSINLESCTFITCMHKYVCVTYILINLRIKLLLPVKKDLINNTTQKSVTLINTAHQLMNINFISRQRVHAQ